MAVEPAVETMGVRAMVLACSKFLNVFFYQTNKPIMLKGQSPLQPNFEQKNRGLQGYTFFLIVALKHRLWVHIRMP